MMVRMKTHGFFYRLHGFVWRSYMHQLIRKNSKHIWIIRSEGNASLRFGERLRDGLRKEMDRIVKIV